ncbi:MAG: DNA-binding transcriptional LysR family regulator [Paracoccaceae bacterium]|jgi:DNA-binding transcriptional LysR family regulator
MKIRLRQLEAFRAVAQFGSVTRAAEHLEISQPAASRLISSFADSVGFTLFDRRDGKLVPTQESRYLLAEVGRVLDSIGHLEELAGDLTARRAGHLRIACLPGFATTHLPRMLSGFLKSRPQVTVTLEPDRPERILEWIIGEQYDCGITDDFPGHPAVEIRSLLVRTACILPKGHALTAKSEIWPEDLAQEKMIHGPRRSGFYHELDDLFTARGVKMPTWVQTRQFASACLLVAEGAGVSVVSELDAQEYAHHGLVLRPFLPSFPHRMAIVRPVSTPLSMVSLEFIEAFVESLSAFQWLEDG